jgi:hypothetical protein
VTNAIQRHSNARSSGIAMSIPMDTNPIEIARNVDHLVFIGASRWDWQFMSSAKATLRSNADCRGNRFVYGAMSTNSFLGAMAEELSISEIAVVAAFAARLAKGAEPMVSVGELKRELSMSDGEARLAMESLNERGWLFVASTLNWHDETECILLGPGREKAEAMAEHLKSQTKTSTESTE